MQVYKQPPVMTSVVNAPRRKPWVPYTCPLDGESENYRYCFLLWATLPHPVCEQRYRVRSSNTTQDFYSTPPAYSRPALSSLLVCQRSHERTEKQVVGTVSLRRVRCTSCAAPPAHPPNGHVDTLLLCSSVVQSSCRGPKKYHLTKDYFGLHKRGSQLV